MNRRREKGVFAGPGLPVAKRYPHSASRRRLWMLALLAAAIVVTVFVLDLAFGDARLVSNGTLSSPHAMLDQDCGACHQGFEKVSAERCSVCHEKHGDQLGVFTFAAHAVYRSNDFSRIQEPEHDVTCAACHTEHEGRDATITAVPDARCERCHDIELFNSRAAEHRHPQFAVLAEGGLERPGLVFPHILHTAEVISTQQLVDVERACLYCHNAQPDGRSFEPIRFDRHCDACHLLQGQSTPELPVRPDGAPETMAADDAIGVETLQSIHDRRPPGSLWAVTANPGEYRVDSGDFGAAGGGRTLRKSPIYHRDPWVLENLRQLRARIFPRAGLADLLDASPEAPAHEVNELYREAVATLRSYALELRAQPQRSVQNQLRQVEELLDRVELALENPYTPLDESRFLLDLLEPDVALTEPQLERLDGLVEQLTEPCRQCHQVERATIVRVQANQRSLRRAEFDHRAHIIQRRCLDCHQEIPIAERILERPTESQSSSLLDPEVDRSELVNLPSIETCQQCHNRGSVDNQCVTCHLFHPNQSRRSDLLLYLAQP